MTDRELTQLQETGEVTLWGANIRLGALAEGVQTLGIDMSRVLIYPTSQRSMRLSVMSRAELDRVRP